jgi:hypothetical protein
MKLWAICRMVPEPGQEGIVPKVALYTDSWRAWSKAGMEWALCRFAITDATGVATDAQIKLLPDATLDLLWSSIANNVRNRVKSEVEAAGFVWSVNNNWSVREVLVYLVNQIQPGVDCCKYDVQDLGQ